MSAITAEPHPANPFDGGVHPRSVTTRNSTYVLTYGERLVSHPCDYGDATCDAFDCTHSEVETVTVYCVEGTFAGMSWTVDTEDVTLTRYNLIVVGGPATTAPTHVDGIPVSVWTD